MLLLPNQQSGQAQIQQQAMLTKRVTARNRLQRCEKRCLVVYFGVLLMSLSAVHYFLLLLCITSCAAVMLTRTSRELCKPASRHTFGHSIGVYCCCTAVKLYTIRWYVQAQQRCIFCRCLSQQLLPNLAASAVASLCKQRDCCTVLYNGC
jgi:hypothetical protein